MENITNTNTTTSNITALERLERRVSKLNDMLARGITDGLSIAMKDVDSAAKDAKEEAQKILLAELCALQPGEVVERYLKDQSYTYPRVTQLETGRRVIENKEAVLPWPAIDGAYYDANRVFLSADKYHARVVACLVYALQRSDLATKITGDYQLAHLDADNEHMWDRLCKSNLCWKNTSNNSFAECFAETVKAILPAGYQPEKLPRRSDVRFAARLILQAQAGNKKAGDRYVTRRLDTIYKCIFRAISNAINNYQYPVYSQTSGLVSGVKVDGNKDKNQKPQEQTTEAAPAPTENAEAAPAAD